VKEPAKAEELDKSKDDKDWRISGKFAVVSFSKREE